MRKLFIKVRTPLAAGLTALAVTVAVPALGQDKPSGGVKEEQSGPEARDLRACLTAHGQDVGATDDYGLKRWIVEHQADPASRDALKACDVFFGEKKPGDGATEAPCVKPVDVAKARRRR